MGVLLADVDGDGDLDAVFADAFREVSWCENRLLTPAFRNFATPRQLLSGDASANFHFANLLSGDFTNRGRNDVVFVSSNGVRVLKNEERALGKRSVTTLTVTNGESTERGCNPCGSLQSALANIREPVDPNIPIQSVVIHMNEGTYREEQGIVVQTYNKYSITIYIDREGVTLECARSPNSVRPACMTLASGGGAIRVVGGPLTLERIPYGEILDVDNEDGWAGVYVVGTGLQNVVQFAHPIVSVCSIETPLQTIGCGHSGPSNNATAHTPNHLYYYQLNAYEPMLTIRGFQTASIPFELNGAGLVVSSNGHDQVGGVYVSSLLVENCIAHVANGGGVSVYNSYIFVVYMDLVNNEALEGGGVFFEGTYISTSIVAIRATNNTAVGGCGGSMFFSSTNLPHIYTPGPIRIGMVESIGHKAEYDGDAICSYLARADILSTISFSQSQSDFQYSNMFVLGGMVKLYDRVSIDGITHNGTEEEYISDSSAFVRCLRGDLVHNVDRLLCSSCATGAAMHEPTGTCEACTAGFYASEFGQTSCSGCEPGTSSSNLGAITCAPCRRGAATPSYNSTSCQECSTGTFQNETGKLECHECPHGKFNTADGSVNCESCSPGEYLNITSNTCQLCEIGTFTNKRGFTNCPSCPLGSTTNSEGSSRCSPCPAGTHMPEGSRECEPCGEGSFTDKSGQTRCSDCGIGKFSSFKGSVACLDCPPGRMSNREGLAECSTCAHHTFSNRTGSTRCLDCTASGQFHFANRTGSQFCDQCDPDKYLRYPNRSDVSSFWGCDACPSHASCSSGQPLAERGYWGSTDPVTGEVETHICHSTDACTGGSACGDHRLPASENILCAKCESGYQESDGECIECSETRYGVVFGLLFASVAFMVFYFYYSQRPTTGEAVVLLYFLQTALLLIGGGNGSVFGVLNDIVNMSWFAAAGCLGPMSDESRMMIGFVSPALLFIELFILSAILRFRKHPIYSYDAFRRTALSLYLLTFNGTVKTAIEVLHCTSFDVNGVEVNVVQAYPQVSCTSGHYQGLATIAGFIMFIWVALVPAALFYLLRTARGNGTLEGLPFLGIILEPFKPQFVFMQLFFLTRRTLLVGIVVGLSTERETLFAVATCLNAAFGFIHSYTLPFGQSIENMAESLTLSVLVVLSVVLGQMDTPYSSRVSLSLILLVIMTAVFAALPKAFSLTKSFNVIYREMSHRWSSRCRNPSAVELQAAAEPRERMGSRVVSSVVNPNGTDFTKNDRSPSHKPVSPPPIHQSSSVASVPEMPSTLADRLSMNEGVDVGHNYQMFVDENGYPYYYNTITKETVWDRPAELGPEGSPANETEIDSSV